MTNIIRAVIAATASAAMLAGMAEAASAAPAHRVTIKANRTVAGSGTTVKVTGSVRRGSKGNKVVLQRKQGSTWTTVATGKLTKRKTYVVRTRVVLNTQSLRIRFNATKRAKAKNSPVISVRGTLNYGSDVVLEGESVRVSGLMTPGRRTVILQARESDNWTSLAGTRTQADGSFSMTIERARNWFIRAVDDVPKAYRKTGPIDALGGEIFTTTVPQLTVTMPPTVGINRDLRAEVSMWPVRPGMTATLKQVTTSSGGRVQASDVASATFNAQGKATVVYRQRAAGTSTYKVTLPKRYAAYLAESGLHDVTVTRPLVLASVADDGTPAESNAVIGAYSSDGKFVAFTSFAKNLAPDTGLGKHLFIRDLTTNTTQTIEVGPDRVRPQDAVDPDFSADGRYLSFSTRTALTAQDTRSGADVYVLDRSTGEATLVSQSIAEVPNAGTSDESSISADGRYVAFSSTANDLVPGDTNEVSDVFVRDVVLGTTVRISASTDGTQTLGGGTGPEISADGRFVSFTSGDETNLQTFPLPASLSVWRYDLHTGTAERVSVGVNAAEPSSGAARSSISGDGRFVVFISTANNLVTGGDSAQQENVYMRDMATGVTRKVTADVSGTNPPQGPSDPKISDDGSTIVYHRVRGPGMSYPNLTLVKLWNVATGETENVSYQADGSLTDFAAGAPLVSATGEKVAYATTNWLMVPGVAKPEAGVFVADMGLR